MKSKSASTLIYFSERINKKTLSKKASRPNRLKLLLSIKKILPIFGFTLLLGFGFWLYARYKPLNVTKVEISGNTRFLNKEDINKVLSEQTIGKNILTLDGESLRKSVTNSFLAAKSVKVFKVFPNTVKIQITERTPVALIKNKNYYFVDSEGFVLGLADPSTTNLPVINFNQQAEVGKFVEGSAINYYFDLIKALDEEKMSVSSINTFSRYTSFYAQGVEVLLNNSEPARTQVKIFAKMLEALKAEGRKPKKIDLRFDKVVVEFDNSDEVMESKAQNQN